MLGEGFYQYICQWGVVIRLVLKVCEISFFEIFVQGEVVIIGWDIDEDIQCVLVDQFEYGVGFEFWQDMYKVFVYQDGQGVQIDVGGMEEWQEV